MSTKKPRLTAVQKAALQIVNDGGELVRVSGKFGGWILKDNHPIRSTTAWAISGGGLSSVATRQRGLKPRRPESHDSARKSLQFIGY